MDMSQSVYGRPRGTTRARPATAMSSHALEFDGGQGQQPTGMQFSSWLQNDARKPRQKKMRSTIPTSSLESLAANVRQQQHRDISGLSRQMGELSLKEKVNTSGGGQVATEQERMSILRPCSSTGAAGKTVQGQREQAARPQFRTAASPSLKTPCRARDIEAEMGRFEAVVKSVCKTPSSPPKFFSPKKQPFLTKDSNVTTFTGWDVDERLHEVESQFRVMKEAMNVSLTDRKTLEDAVDLAKTRGVYRVSVSRGGR